MRHRPATFAALAVSAAGCALLAGCATGGDAAVAAQFVRIGSDRFTNDGGGLAFFGLGTEEEPASLFLEARYTESGDADGDRYSEVPPGHANDPVLGREGRYGTSVHVGPTLQLTDWLYVYGGVGVGYRQDVERRFDIGNTLGGGDYLVGANERWALSGTFGVLVRPQEELLLGIGYDTFFEGLVVTLGLAF